MRREAEFLPDGEGVLLYIAKRLREAQALEEVFTNSGVDYVVEVDHYRGGLIFQTLRAGAFFYVRPDAAETAKELMRRNGYKPYEPFG